MALGCDASNDACAKRCENTSIAAAIENTSFDLREHAQTTPHVMGSTPICGWAMGVAALANATRKVY